LKARLSFFSVLFCIGLIAIASLMGSAGWGANAQFWWQIRAPRVANSVLVGSLLGLAGALMQSVVRNPLAEPYLFGTSAGAGLAVLVAVVLLPSLDQSDWLGAVSFTSAAFVGALMSTIAVLALGRLAGLRDSARLVVVGVALASLLGALIQVVSLWAADASIRGVFYWLLGSISESWPVAWIFVLAVICFVWAFGEHRAIDAVSFGRAMARNFGIDERKANRRLLICASLCTALAVSLAGAIGFIGLAAPHIARRLFGPSALYAVPGAALVGATIVTVADAIGRVMLAPQVIPVGVMTTLLGVPVLIHLLLQRRGGQ
jgi:iron complex transport system permease protein